jgi:aspartyl-tRNA(Asn)/glutamyl-tRNA(Gln) amidotransferase subunit B
VVVFFGYCLSSVFVVVVVVVGVVFGFVVVVVDGSVVNALLANQAFAEVVSEVQGAAGDSVAKRVANWFASSIQTDEHTSTVVYKLVPDSFVELAKMVEANELSSTTAKEVFNELLSSNKTAREIAESKNLLQVSDEGAIAAIVDEVLADPASQKAVEDIKSGNDKAIGFLVGQIMKKSQGKANPALAQKLIRERL